MSNPEQIYQVNLKQWSESANKDELDNIIPKEIFEKLKAEFPERIEEIFLISRKELDELKELVRTGQYEKIKEMISRELQESSIENTLNDENTDKSELEKKYDLDTVLNWAEAPQIDKIKNVFLLAISEKLEAYNLDSNIQKNISVAVMWKILNNLTWSELLNLSDSISDIVSKLENWDIDEALESWWAQIEWMWKIKSILDNNIGDLISFLDLKKPNYELFNGFLSNPKAMWEYEYDETKIEDLKDTKPLEWNWLIEYLTDINLKVLEYDKKLSNFLQTKEWIISSISKLPEMAQEVVKWLLWLLLKIPFLGDLLAWILWYSNSKEAESWIWDELKFAKATNNLKKFWWKFDENWEKLSYSDQDNEISILKDKDLTWLKYSKLTPFYKNLLKNWLSFDKPDFWFVLFNGKGWELSEQDQKIMILHEKLNQDKITNDDFENSKPKESFYKKLNNLYFEENTSSEQIGNTVESSTLTDQEKQDLQKKQEKFDSYISTLDWFEKSIKEWDWTLDFSWLDEENMNSFKAIKLEKFLWDTYENDIKSSVDTVTGWDWFDSLIDFDYDSIKNQVSVLRAILKELWNDKIKEITWKEIKDTSIWDIIKNENLSKFLEIYKAKQEEISEKLWDDTLLDWIKSSIDDLANWNIETIAWNPEIIIDYDKQKIKVWEHTYNIVLPMNYKITSIDKTSTGIVFNANHSLLSSRTLNKTEDFFVSELFKLAKWNDIEIELEEWRKIEIKKQV